MRIPDNIKNCVVFLGHGSDLDDFKIGGTGFLIGRPGSIFTYLATAKHNAITLGSQFSVRINMRNEQCGLVQFQSPEWFYHADKFVDAAIALWPWNKVFDCQYINTDSVGSEQVIRDRGIGIGDDVVIPGCYFRVSGRKRNMPIVRNGTITMMPSEKIPITLLDESKNLIRGDADAYLIEGKSVGSLSGSPVFVRQYIQEGNNLWNQFYHLLGLIHGHWDIREMSSEYLQTINEGIVHVVPVYKLIEILNNHPKLVQIRKDIDKEMKNSTEHDPERGFKLIESTVGSVILFR